MFPVDRIYNSYVQLENAAKYFLEEWNYKKVRNSKIVICLYGTNQIYFV